MFNICLTLGHRLRFWSLPSHITSKGPKHDHQQDAGVTWICIIPLLQVEDLPQPFNALSYLMVARYAVQATVVNELLGFRGGVRNKLPPQLQPTPAMALIWDTICSRSKVQLRCEGWLPASGWARMVGIYTSFGIIKWGSVQHVKGNTMLKLPFIFPSLGGMWPSTVQGVCVPSSGMEEQFGRSLRPIPLRFLLHQPRDDGGRWVQPQPSAISCIGSIWSSTFSRQTRSATEEPMVVWFLLRFFWDPQRLQTGGLCPVLSCEDALAFLGMDQIWPMGGSHEEIWDISHPMFGPNPWSVELPILGFCEESIGQSPKFESQRAALNFMIHTVTQWQYLSGACLSDIHFRNNWYPVPPPRFRWESIQILPCWYAGSVGDFVRFGERTIMNTPCLVFSRKLASASWSLLALASIPGAAQGHHVIFHAKGGDPPLVFVST